MKKFVADIQSVNLQKKMHIGVYGHFGFAVLLFPSISDDFEEVEREGLIDSLSNFTNSGRCKIYSVDSVNHESWLNHDISPEKKSQRMLEYNLFIVEEVVPLIYADSGGPIPILTAGCSIGAFHAANQYFRRPDIFLGTIALSGNYNISNYTDGYFDDNCYFNSPVHYLPNLNDKYWLSFLVSKGHVYIASGSGEGENPERTNHLGDILTVKNIPHVLEIWDTTYGHNYKTWQSMLPMYLSRKF